MQFSFATRVDYNDDFKARFHREARDRLVKLATMIPLEPGSFDLRNNRGGVAVSGEITLHAEAIYIQVSQSCVGVGMGVLVRTCQGRADFTGGQNN